jgi:hypothetical protein
MGPFVFPKPFPVRSERAVTVRRPATQKAWFLQLDFARACASGFRLLLLDRPPLSPANFCVCFQASRLTADCQAQRKGRRPTARSDPAHFANGKRPALGQGSPQQRRSVELLPRHVPSLRINISGSFQIASGWARAFRSAIFGRSAWGAFSIIPFNERSGQREATIQSEAK